MTQGTFRNDRNPENEPEPEKILDIPKPPSFLNKYSKKLWKSLAAELVDKKVLTVVDIAALEVCCDLYGQYREAREAVYKIIINPVTGKKRRQTFAEYMNGKNSQTMPEYTAMTKTYASFKSYLSEFGLTPASRNKIDIPPDKEEKDKMRALLNA